MIELGYIKNNPVPASTKKQRIELARKRIEEILHNLPDEEKRTAFSVGQGYSGLKAKVKNQFSRKEYLELFPNLYDFNNRWREVKPSGNPPINNRS